jgi:parallel beta-helix repeat protein
MTADYNYNQITGPGAIAAQVPNGIFFIVNATGSATYNTVTDLGYTGGTYRATGIGTYSAGNGIVFSHNEISKVQNAFALSVNTNGTTVEYNTVHDCHTGVRIESGAANCLVQYNDIHDNTYAIRCGGVSTSEDMGSGNQAHYNHFVNNAPGTGYPPCVGAVSVDPTATYDLDARYNWWGANDGPGSIGTGSGDTVSADVSYIPWTEQTLTHAGTATVPSPPARATLR